MLNTFGVDIIPPDDEGRLAALHRFQIVDTPPEEVFDNFSHLIAEVFNVPIALISLVDRERVFFKGNVGMPGVRYVDRGVSLCSLAVLSAHPTIITEPLHDPCLLANPLVHGNFGLRFYAGAPIVTSDGFNIGTVCIVDKQERTFSESDKNKLVRFARAVMQSIESRLITVQQLQQQAEVAQKGKELEQVYQDMRFLTNSVPQLVWSRDVDGMPLFLNDRWVEYTGLQEEELRRHGWQLVMHPDDSARATEAWTEARRTGDAYEVAYRLKRHDGMYRWFLGRANPLKDGNGKVLKWYGTSTDIHEQKTFEVQLEQKVVERTAALEKQRNLLDSILKHSPSGITVYTSVLNHQGQVADMQCILANDAAETFTGLPLNERLGKTVLQLTPGLAASPLWQQAIKTLTDGTPFRTEYYYEPAKAWLELSVVKMDDKHIINVFRDITPVKVAQRQLERHIEELKQANAELEHFAYAASHDMKEPVRKVNIFADRLKQTFTQALTETQHHYFNRMQSAALRMNALIDDLLLYTRVSNGLPQAQRVDLNKIISEVKADLELEIEETSAVIEVGTMPVIDGHARQLQQVFHNLISNALKYRKPGVTPHVQITCRKILVADAGEPLPLQHLTAHCYQLDVIDNGVGFEQQEAERIFRVFQRLHTIECTGTGIGLSIVRKTMQNHHGFVRAIGQPMQGATFQLFFPEQQPATPVAV